jgi:hypothetical protein
VQAVQIVAGELWLLRVLARDALVKLIGRRLLLHESAHL